MTKAVFHQAGADQLRAFQQERGSDFSALSAEDRVQLQAIERLIETEEVVVALIHRIGSATRQLSTAMACWRMALGAVNE